MRRTSQPAVLSLCGALALALPSRSVVAQDGAVPVYPGARVRVSSPALGLTRQVAIVDTADGAALVLVRAGRRDPWPSTSGDRLRVPMAAVTLLEQSLGQGGRNAGAVIGGVILGGLAGAVVGGFLGYYGSGGGKADKTYGDGMGVLAGVPLGSAAGALLGGVLGSRYRPERWAAIALPPRRTNVP